MRHHFAAALIAGIATLSVPAIAAPLIYDESVDGALDSDFRLLGNLGVGVNSVSGSRSFFERFSVVLPETLQLTDVSIVVSDIVLQSATRSAGQIVVQGALSASSRFNTNGTYDLFSGSLDGDATINVSLLGFTVGDGNVGVSYDYTVSFTVVDSNDVPEPATLTLLGLGLAGAGFSVARRRRATS